MACICRDIAGMKAELRKFKYENCSTNWKVHDEPDELLVGATDDEIVILFNIHCMPGKYESRQAPIKPAGTKTRKNSNHG